jgi:hypothetical protein
MSRLTESEIEKFAIKLLQRLGYSYIYAPPILRQIRMRRSGAVMMRWS